MNGAVIAEYRPVREPDHVDARRTNHDSAEEIELRRPS